MDIFGFHVPTLIAVAGSASAAFAGVYRAFAKFDGDQSEENRKFTRDWLLGLNVDRYKWGKFFEGLFAKLFGPRHLSLMCIRRSVIFQIKTAFDPENVFRHAQSIPVTG